MAELKAASNRPMALVADLERSRMSWSADQDYEGKIQAIVDAVNPALERQADMINKLVPNGG